jgi:hypothetical protein
MHYKEILLDSTLPGFAFPFNISFSITFKDPGRPREGKFVVESK